MDIGETIFSFFISFFLPPPPPLPLSTNVVISSFIECMPVESHFHPPFPNLMCECVCVGVWEGGGGVGGWVDVQARVSICECVCLLYPSIFIFSSSFCFG